MSLPPSKIPFVFPLQLGTLDHFTAPLEGHVMAAPRWHAEAGEAFVGNGYIAMRVTGRLWDESDFAPAETRFLDRFLKLPWDRFATLAEADWKPMDDIRGTIYRFAPIGCWIERKRGDLPSRWKVAPSPVVNVADAHLVRLSHLQLIARLPRCQVQTRESTGHTALFFRFNGGRGLIPFDETVTKTNPAFTIFRAQRDYTGELTPRNSGPCVLKKEPKWPAFEKLPPVGKDLKS